LGYTLFILEVEKMKKLFALVLTLSMLLSMAACGKPDVSTPTQPSELTEPSVTEPQVTDPQVTDPSLLDDRTKPIIDSISIDKNEVRVGEEIHITMAITDESKITHCSIGFEMTNGAIKYCYLKEGDDGLYHIAVKIDDTFVSGKCILSWIQIEDACGNYLRGSDLAAKYTDIYFDVIK
jgi:hypothetical protein